MARAAEIAAGDSLLDVACGSGEFCELVTARGARVGRIDAAAGLIEHARRRLPAADLRVGPIEQLPWPAESFDLVAGFNAVQFAADFVAPCSRGAACLQICNDPHEGLTCDGLRLGQESA